MTFSDIFKSSFLENVTSVSLLDMALALVLAFGVGMFIFLIYKKTYAGVMYSSSFGVTLVALTMITTLVILAVTSNVVLFIPLAVIGSVVIGVILLVFANHKSHANPYIVVISCRDQASETEAMKLLAECTQRCACKSKTVRAGKIELNLEVRLKDENTDFINGVSGLRGVDSAVLVSYNGDYMG